MGNSTFYKSPAILLLTVLLASVLPASLEAQSWYSSAWTLRKPITIDFTKVGAGPHTNFPVLISITDANLQAGAMANGNDIVFTSSDGTTKLNHEIETYVSATGTLTAWVNVPTLSSSANTVIYMYYGNTSAAAQQNITGTWNTSFKGVYHMNGTAGTTIADATNANNGTNYGTYDTLGKISRARRFFPANGADSISIAGLMGSPASVNLSAWVNWVTPDTDGGGTGQSEVISLGDHIAIRMYATSTTGFFLSSGGWVGTTVNTGYQGGWHYLSYAYAGGASAQNLYIDGALVASSTNASPIIYTGQGANTRIGTHGNSSTQTDFGGTMDEVRVASSARSAGWIKTEYNNQNSPSTFCTAGAQSCIPPAAPAVSSPVSYCQNATATQLTATGTSLLWGSATGSVGGTAILPNQAYIDNTAGHNDKTNFTTTAANVTITSVDYSIPSYQGVSGLVLSIYNSSGTVIATSTTNTTSSGNAAVSVVNNTFNFTIAAAGNYSIGVSAGSGNIGSDNPTFPITEPTGTVSITGVSIATYRCFNNIQFVTGSSSVAPTPSTAVTGSKNYFVSQTIGGCVSTQASIVVNVTSINISQVPTSGLIAYYKFSGDATDASGNNNGTLQNAPTSVADRFGIANKSFNFNGSSQYVSTANSYTNPTDFTVSIWFKTNTAAGGRLIGFGDAQTGISGNYDRHIYMNNAGQLYFGVFPGSVQTVNSTLSYNDNTWHLATASLSSTAGMALYVDGVLVGSNASITTAQNYTGYWRIGYDINDNWTSQPSSFYFAGNLDDALIFSRALAAAEVTTIYTSPDGAGNNGPVCAGASVSLGATTVSGATYAWSGPGGFTSASQNPSLTYTAANAGVYTLQITSAGCTATAYTNVTSTATAGQWTGATSTDWSVAGNWCAGVVPTSTTNVVIPSTATRMPTIITSVVCNNLTINTGATLTTSLGGSLNISGTLTNNGTMANSGTTNFNGTVAQTFAGVATFYNLTVSNTVSLSLPGIIAVNNNLLIAAGTLIANNNNISLKGNWTNNSSATAFTAGTATVNFNGTTADSIGGTFVTTFNNLTITGATAAITLTANTSIAGNLTVSSGIFDLAGFIANRTAAGGSISMGNSATLKIGGTNTFPANYTASTLAVASTVEYSGSNQTVSNQLYGNLILSSVSGAAVKTFPATALTVVGNLISKLGAGTSVAFTAASNITVNGNDSIGASTTFNGGSYSHSIGGNWFNNGTFNGNTGTVTMAGPGAVVSGAGAQNFNNLTISASNVSFTAITISLSGNLSTTSSGSFSQAPGGTLSMTGIGASINGSGIVLNNLTVSGSVTTATSFNLTGNLSVSGSFASGAGAITMSGTAKTISGAGGIGFGILVISGSITTASSFSIASGLSINGSLTASAGTATFTGTSSLSGTANLFNTVVNGTSLQLSSNAILGIANLLTLTAGTLNVTSSTPNTVNFNSTGPQNINAITYDNLVLSNGNSKTATAALTVNNSFTIGTGTTFIPGAFTHNINVNWANNGTFTAGTSTIQFSGSQNSTITGATTFNILTVNKTNAATTTSLLSSVSASTVNMTLGTLSTGAANTLTITTTRTGNGIILGNIQRTHAFTTGVAYAFESPNNTVTFTAVSAVTTITVSVVKGSISDFPFGGSVSRLYTIAVPAGSYTATLRLHYENVELNGNTESTMALWQYNGSAWGAIGKTANDTINNYVEQSGLTNITNRWTFSDNSNVVQWNGSVSSAWNNAANWTVVQGSASTPPSSSDIANLGTGTFTNQPSISTAVNVKSINFGSAQAVTLSMAAGGALTAGSIKGTWGANATHIINVNNQTITTNGGLVLSDGTSGHAINLNIGAGSVNVIGSLNQSGGANIVFSGAGNMNITNNFNYTSGTFTAGTGTVTYNGSANQIVAPVTYNNLNINKSAAIASINNITTVGGNLTVTAGEIDNFSTTTIAGNVTISTGAILSNTGTLYVSGNWANTGSLTDAGANVIFNGTGPQSITATTFNNFTVSKPVGSIATLLGDIGVNGDFTVTSGTLAVKSYNLSRSTLGGTISVADAGTVIISGNNPPVNYANFSYANASTIIFDGTAAQAFALAAPFGNLILRNGGLKTLAAPITVNGDLTIEPGVTFDGSSQTLTLNGNWINSGTFAPSTSTVICNGTAKNITGNTTFNRISVYGSYTFLNNVTINTLLVINSTGSLSGGSSIITTLNGDLTNYGTLYTLGTTTFTGNVLQTLSLINAVQTVALTVNFNGTVSPVLNSTSAPQFGYLNINNTGGVNPSIGWTILNALTIGSGASFNGGIFTHAILGNLTNNGTVTSSGVLNFIPPAAATINMGTNFSSTGSVAFGGAGALTLAGTPSSFYNVFITNTNAAAITPSSAWKVTNNFTVNSGAIFNAAAYIDSVGGNILVNGTLNSGTSTFALNGIAAQNIYSASPFNNLTIIDSVAPVTLISDVTVNGILKFTRGKIQTGSNLLILPASGTVAGAAQGTGWVYGKLQKNIATGATAKTYEVGDSATYAPVSLSFSNVATAGNLVASTTYGLQPNISSSTINQNKNVNRYWTLTNSGTGFTDYSGTFNFATADVDGGATPANFKVGIYNGSSWILPVTSSANATNTTATGVSTMGDFAIGEICNVSTTISYPASPYCSSAGTAAVTLTGNGGGVYGSSNGLSINGSTGAINLSASTPGAYIVNYTLAATGGCSSFQTSANIIISAAPTATISYTGSPYCSSYGTITVTFSGAPGGKYSSTAGLVIDSTYGTVNPATSTAGTYTVTYTVAAAAGCSAYTTTTTITITTQPYATGTYTGTPYCSNGGTAYPTGLAVGAAGTVFSTTGLVVDPVTGYVNLATSTPGFYTVTYSVAASGGCNAYSNTSTIGISTAPSASISYAGTPYCSSAAPDSAIRTGKAGGVYSSSAGLTINSGNGLITFSSSTPGNYIVTYTIAAYGGCPTYTTTAAVTVSSPSSATISYAGSPYYTNAGTAAVTRSGTAGGAYSAPVGLSINAGTGAITLASSTAGIYTVTYTVAATGGCSIFTTTTSVTILTPNGIWTGAVNTDWTNAGNWSNSIVPTASIDVIIPAVTNQPVIVTGVNSKGLTINSGATVTTAAAGTLNIAGNISNSGSMTNNGTTTFSGATQQTFTGVSTFNNLTLNNSAGLLLGGVISINGNLIISSGTLNTNNNNITLSGNWINNGGFTADTATVTFTGSTTISGTTTTNTFNNFTVAASSIVGASTSVTGLIVNGTLTTGASSIFDLGTTAILSGALSTISNAGLIKTAVPTATSTIPIPAGKIWGGTGTVYYTASGGAQTIVSGTYYNLTSGNSSGTNTAGGEIITNNQFVTVLGGTLDMGSLYRLVTNNVFNDGTVKTSVLTTTSNTPVSPGVVWIGAGTVEYASLTGGQTFVGGIYDNVKLSNSSGINTPGADIAVNGQLNTVAGGTLDMGTLYRFMSGGTIVNNGAIKTSVLTTTSTSPLAPGKNWAGTGTVEYAAATGGQTVVDGTFYNLKLGNTSGNNTAGGNATIGGILTFNGGTITTGSSYKIYINATGSVARPGTGHVIGNFQKNVATGATTKTFEIGDANNYSPVTAAFASVTTAGDLTASVIATDHPNLSGSGISTTKSVNRYWTLANSGIVFTTAALTMNWVAGDADDATTPENFKVGTYNNPNWTFPSVASPLATSIQATGLTNFGDFAVGEMCTLSGFSYAGTPYCSNGGTASPTITGTAGTFASTAGLSINAATGAVNLAASTPGTYTVTNTVSTGGCSSAASITILTAPTVSGTSTVTCVGGSTGTITATGSGGTPPYTYNLNAGAYQASATFTGLAAATYTLNVKSNAGCVASTSVVVSDYAPSSDDQNAAGTNSWIGHVYDGTDFNNYIGHYTESENFTQDFGGSYTCFPVMSNAVSRTIYAESFSIKYKMISTKKGLYVADIGSDDGGRVTVDGTMLYNFWGSWSITNFPSILMNLNGSSSLLYEYYEGGGGNRVAFTNLTLVMANALSTNTTQTICSGATGTAISGDVYGTLPSGITLSGTGYQWTYSTTPAGTRTNISGATGANYVATGTGTPFSTPGTYYLYRNTILSSTNNVSPNPYVATNESNAATITISPVSSATISYASSAYCGNAGTASVTLTGTTGGTYSSTAGLTINSGTGTITLATSTAGTYTVSYTMVNGSCTTSTTTSVVVTAPPAATISYPATPYCSTGGTATPTLTGTSGGTYSSTTGLTINSANGVVTLNTSILGTYTITYTVAATGGCGQFQTTTTLSIITAGTWTGTVSTNWNTGGNWLCGGIPTATTNVTIPGNLTFYPVLTGVKGTVNNIALQSGASLTITGDTLQIAGSINNSGTINAASGYITMNGTSAQTIPAATFAGNAVQRLTVGNPTTVTLGGALSVTDVLTVSAGTLASGGNLTLKSTLLNTARVAPLPVDGNGAATAFITGNVTVERYIPVRRAWRLLTAPLSNTGTIFSSWQNGGVYTPGLDLFVTGPGPSTANGLDSSNQNSASMKYFDTVTHNYLSVTNTKTASLSKNTGNADNIPYFIFVRGDRNPVNLSTSYSNITTLSSAGKLQTGKQTFPATSAYNTFTLMGNPYASPIDFSNVQRTHLMKRFYAWDPTLNLLGAYVTIDDINGTGTFTSSNPSGSLQDKNIQSGQAFFVLTDTAGAPALTYYESSKSSVVNNTGFRPMGQPASIVTNLYLLNADNSRVTADACVAQFGDGFCGCVNLQDAVKFININETLSLLRDGVSVAIERRPVINANDTLYLKLERATKRNYRLLIQASNFNQPSATAFLQDKYTGINTPVNLSDSTGVNFTINSDSGSIKTDRFRIVFREATVLAVTYGDVKAWQLGANIAVNWNVENQVNIRNYEVEKSTDGTNFMSVNTQPATGTNGASAAYYWLDTHAAAGSNFYRIRNVNLDGSTAYSKVVKVDMAAGAGKIVVYPNPSTGNSIGLQYSNMPAGKYKLRLLNTVGQALVIKEINHAGGTSLETLKLSSYIAKGIYNLEITNPDKTQTNIIVVNQ